MLTLLTTIALLAAQPTGAALAADAETLRAEAEARAQHLAAAPGAPGVPLGADDAFLGGVEEFALSAALLARHVDASGGPSDLGCIFRGMSADAGTRLNELNSAETAADQARAYQEYARLFTQAVVIAPDADDPDADDPAPDAPPQTCPVQPIVDVSLDF